MNRRKKVEFSAKVLEKPRRQRTREDALVQRNRDKRGRVVDPEEDP